MLLNLYDVLLEEICSWIGVTSIHIRDVCKRFKNIIPIKNIDQQEVLQALVCGNITTGHARLIHKLQPFTIRPSSQMWDFASKDINIVRCLVETSGYESLCCQVSAMISCMQRSCRSGEIKHAQWILAKIGCKGIDFPHTDMLANICISGNKTMFDWYVHEQALDTLKYWTQDIIECSFRDMVLSPFFNIIKVRKFFNDFHVSRSCVAQLLIESVSYSTEVFDFLQSLLVKTRALSRYVSLAKINNLDKTIARYISYQYKRRRLDLF